MIEWQQMLDVAAAGWGEQNMAAARHCVADAPSVVVQIAADYLAARNLWEEPDDDARSALEACYLANAAHLRTRVPANQASVLADIFYSDLEDAHWHLLPEIRCRCGAAYKVTTPTPTKHDWLSPVDGGPALQANHACRCGRPLLHIGEPEQLAMTL